MSSNAAMPPEVRQFIGRARVGHLATADAEGQPSVVPICFVHRRSQLFSLIDKKSKYTEGHRLKRVRNLLVNPQASVVIDRWDEDWSRIGWVLLRGRAEILESCPGRVLQLFREKYPQYREMSLDGQPTIRLDITSYRAWGHLSISPFAE